MVRVFFIIGLFSILDIALSREYPYFYRSGYYLGRGDAGIATADGEEAIFYNPAGLAQGKGIYKRTILASPLVEFSRDTRDVVRKVSFQDKDPTDTLRDHMGKVQHIGVSNYSGIMLRKSALGVYAYSSTSVMLSKDVEGGGFERLDIETRNDAGGVFTIAQRIKKSPILIGATFKYIVRGQAALFSNISDSKKIEAFQENNEDGVTGTGAGVDIGFLLQGKKNNRFSAALGLTIQDVGNTTFKLIDSNSSGKGTTGLNSNTQTVNLGFALIFGTASSKFKLLADYRDALGAIAEDSYFKKIHMGMELTLLDIIGFTAGLNQGYPTFGIYTDTRIVRIDAGIYTEELYDRVGYRPDTRGFFKLSVGI